MAALAAIWRNRDNAVNCNWKLMSRRAGPLQPAAVSDTLLLAFTETDR